MLQCEKAFGVRGEVDTVDAGGGGGGGGGGHSVCVGTGWQSCSQTIFLSQMEGNVDN